MAPRGQDRRQGAGLCLSDDADDADDAGDATDHDVVDAANDAARARQVL